MRYREKVRECALEIERPKLMNSVPDIFCLPNLTAPVRLK